MMNKYQRTPLEFKTAAKKLNLDFWPVHDCSLCKYQCGYRFTLDYEVVMYDSGCYCTNTRTLRSQNWNDIARYYNAQKNKQVIYEMNQFWRFSAKMNKYQAFAVAHFLTEWPENVDFYGLITMILKSELDDIIVWEPFDDFPIEDLAELIQDMADNLEGCFK